MSNLFSHSSCLVRLTQRDPGTIGLFGLPTRYYRGQAKTIQRFPSRLLFNPVEMRSGAEDERIVRDCWGCHEAVRQLVGG